MSLREEFWKKLEKEIHSLPKEEIRGKRRSSIPSGEICFRVEAPRGENFHYLISTGKSASRVRVRPPTYANFAALPEILINYKLSDAAAIISSIDPCFSCMDRVAILDLNTGEKRVVDIRKECSEHEE